MARTERQELERSARDGDPLAMAAMADRCEDEGDEAGMILWRTSWLWMGQLVRDYPRRGSVLGFAGRMRFVRLPMCDGSPPAWMRISLGRKCFHATPWHGRHHHESARIHYSRCLSPRAWAKVPRLVQGVLWMKASLEPHHIVEAGRQAVSPSWRGIMPELPMGG